MISEIIIVCDFDRFGKQIINYFERNDSVLGKSIKFVEDKKK
jgi:mannose-1-phosphate guanylyltransferase